jgi:hypothetical protein
VGQKRENNLYVNALASWYCCELRVGMPNLPGRVASPHAHNTKYMGSLA